MKGISAETLQLVKDALANGNEDLAKGISIATGLTAYDLQAPAKNLYPVITPLRNSIARVTRANPGDATRWKVISNITGSGFDNMGWVPEGQRAGAMSYTTANKSAAYVTMGEEDYFTFEAEAASVGFENINATSTMRLLQKLMLKEERGIVGGNASLALGTTPTPTLSQATLTGATLPTLTYSVIVVALTFEGWKNSSLSGGLPGQQTVTGRDGNTFTLNGGAARKSAAATQAITLGQALYGTVTPVNGAVAYAWYVGAAGSEKLEAITTINSVSFSAPLLGTGQAASALTAADYSQNSSLAFDGLLTWNATASAGGTALRVVQPAGTLGTGTPLTASGRGSVVEIDNLFQSMWDQYRISPTVLYVNSQEQKNITNKILSNASGPLLRYMAPNNGGDPYGITAGGVIRSYYNPFTMNGGQEIPVMLHPDIPPGTILAWAEQLPPWYQSNEVPNVVEIINRRDYYRIDWPLRTRAREFGTYVEEVLACYFPSAIGVLTNIGNG